MCQSKAQGGHRCASYARKSYQRAARGTREWDDAAAQYAATSEGHAVIDDLRFRARLDGDFSLEAACRSALTRASNIRFAQRLAAAG